MSEVGPPPDDAEQPQRRIEGEHFAAPYEATVELVLRQPPFMLTEGKFHRLKHRPNPVLAGVTGALFALSATRGLPLVIGYFRKEPVSGVDVLMAVAFLVAGLVMFGVSLLLNKPRKQVMKEIEHHFENSPTDLGYRMKKKAP